MAAKSRSEDEATTPTRAEGRAPPNRPFNGSLTTTQLAAEIARCLRAQYSTPLKEPLPDELAILVRQLQEREGARPPGQREPDAKPTEP